MKKSVLILICSVLFINANAQLNVVISMPPLSSRLSELLEQSENILITITNTSMQPITFKTSGELYLDNNVLAQLSLSNSPEETIDALQSKMYRVRDITSRLSDAVSYDNQFALTVLRTGYIPAGVLRWCFALYDANNPSIILAQEQCRSMIVTSYQPPIALAPENGTSIHQNTIPIFRWSPVTPTYRGVLTYRVSVFEIMPGQDAMQAFRSNMPIWERTSQALQLFWPIEVPRENGQYLWTIQALDSDNNPVGSHETFAEFRTFSIEGLSQSGNLSENFSNETSGGFVRARFFNRGTQSLVYEMLLPTTNLQAVREMFALSDQSNSLTLSLDEVPQILSNAQNVGYGIFDAFGNLFLVLTEERIVLSFTSNDQNSNLIGRNAGSRNVWRDADNPLNSELQRRLSQIVRNLTGSIF